jgi:hypothetical protein
VPVPTSRLASCIGALSATVLVGGMCAGAAAAGPDGQPDADRSGDSSKGNLIGSTLGVVGALTRGHGSAQPVQRALTVPGAVVGAVTGTASRTVATVNAHLAPKKPAAKLPTTQPEQIAPDDTAAATPPTDAPEAPADPVAPAPLSAITVTVPALPALPLLPLPVFPAPPPVPVSIPLPQGPFLPATVYSVDLTSPITAYASVQDTYETTNSLVTDAAQPVNPFRAATPDPEPEPDPPTQVYERQSVAAAEDTPAVVDASGMPSGSGSIGADDLSVVRMPSVAMAARLAPPRPFSEGGPAAAAPDGLVGGGAVPTVRGPETLVGGAAAPPAIRLDSARTGQGTESALNTMTSPAANSPLRENFSPNLRNSRMVELTSVALPGLAGLLAITVSGGIIGYRQANSGRYLRTDADRFLA